MKRLLKTLLLAALIVTSLAAVSCTIDPNTGKHKITFMPDNGTTIAAQYATDGSHIQVPENVTKRGHTLEGWYVSLNGGLTYDEPWSFTSNKVKNDMTLYAKWVVNNYTVSFFSGYGSALSPMTVPFEGVLNLPLPIRTGYSFLGWHSDSSLSKPFNDTTMPDQDFILYAKWQPMQYTVTFVTNSQSYVESVTQDFDTILTRPEDPTREGYEFVGWSQFDSPSSLYTFNKVPAGDITLYGQWKAIEYTITLNTMFGTDLPPIVQDFGTTVAAPADPTREGYTFTGWYANQYLSDPYTFTTMPLGGAIVYAGWQINTYTITFNSYGGSYVSPITRQYGEPISAPTAPWLTGYTFIGWFTQYDYYNPYTFDTMPAHDLELTARWEINFTYTAGASATITGVSSYGMNNTILQIPETIGSLSVTKIDDYAFSGLNNLTSIVMPQTITTIGSYAFAGCSSVESITIPQNVTTIDSYAFANCSSLRSVLFYTYNLTTLSEGLFMGCSSLEIDSLPSSITTISSYAFTDCAAIESFTVPSSVNTIGTAAFNGCYNLKSLSLPFVGYSSTATGEQALLGYIFGNAIYSSSTSIGQQHAGGTAYYYIPDALSEVELRTNTVPYGAFSYCNGLTTVNINAYNPSVGDFAFAGCSNLQTLSYNGSLVAVGSCAFINCRALESVDVGAPTVGSYAFTGCTSLSSITLEYGVGTIENSAFSYCESLASINIPTSVTSIGVSAFANCYDLASVNIPTSVNSIGVSAFANCTSLESFTAPSVSTIGYAALSGCYSLERVSLPFVGHSSTATGAQALLGYIFGENYYSNAYQASQYYSYGTAYYYIPNSLVEVTILASSIPSYAFYNCSSLLAINLPANPTIGSYAFYGCSSLATLPSLHGISSITTSMFENCSSLESLFLPSNITTIGNNAFSGCSSLTSVTLTTNVTSIGNYVFSRCSSLQSIVIPFVGSSSTAYYSASVFGHLFGNSYYSNSYSAHQLYSGGSYVTHYIPESLTSVTVLSGDIPYGAFSGCRSIQSVVMEYGISEIENYAFSNCTSLGAVTIPSSVQSIGENAFAYCSGLVSVTIEDGVQSIGDYAFYNCTALASVTIPGSVQTIRSYAFAYCADLVSVTIEYGVQSIGSYAFYECISLGAVTIPGSVQTIEGHAFAHCYDLVSVTIEDGVQSIGSYAFYICSSLAAVTIPGSVQTIGSYTFAYCYDLVSVTIENGVQSIGDSAFYSCTALASVTISGSVQTIGNDAFAHCSALASVSLEYGLNTIGNNAFDSCTSIISLTIPNSVTAVGSEAFRQWTAAQYLTVNDYNAASWNYNWAYECYANITRV